MVLMGRNRFIIFYFTFSKFLKRQHLTFPQPKATALDDNVQSRHGSGHDEEDLPGLHVEVPARDRRFGRFRFPLSKAEQWRLKDDPSFG